MEQRRFDYGIIGAGPAGFTTALCAAKNGKTVVLFEKEYLGGVCLNNGCIPTKTILHSVELFNKIKNAQDIGIEIDGAKLNIKKVMERKTKVIETLKKGLEFKLKQRKVEIILNEAKVISDNIIEAGGKTYDCEKIVVATGSVPKCLNGYEFDHKFILNSDDLFMLEEIPKRVVIIGAGAEGIEWARIFNAMDVEVSIVEATSRMLPFADEEVSKRIERMFKQKNIKMYLSTTVENLNDNKVKLSNKEILEADFVLVAIGRKVQKPEINGKVTYLGDVCGNLMVANYAIYQARALVSGIHFDNVFIPSVIFGNPEIAWIGACEQDLPLNSYQKSIFPISALGKAYCDNDTEGFIKVLSYNGEIIGAHIISKEASALIHQFAVAMQNNISVEDFKKVCFAHPTYSEGVYESILNL